MRSMDVPIYVQLLKLNQSYANYGFSSANGVSSPQGASQEQLKHVDHISSGQITNDKLGVRLPWNLGYILQVAFVNSVLRSNNETFAVTKFKLQSKADHLPTAAVNLVTKSAKNKTFLLRLTEV